MSRSITIGNIPQWTSAAYGKYAANQEIIDVIRVASDDIVYTPGMEKLYVSNINTARFVYANDPHDFTRPIRWQKLRHLENVMKYNEELSGI